MREEAEVLKEIRSALEGTGERKAKFERVAAILQEAGGYRWIGLYDVMENEIVLAAWSGAGPPAHRRFPVSQGLCGEAVRTRRPVVVGDVSKDPRYLKTLESTRSEIVVPIFDSVTGETRGLIDAESDRPDAFGEEDRDFLERCAAELGTAVSPSPG